MAVMVIGKNRTLSDFNKAKKGLGGPTSQDCSIYGIFSTQGIRCKLSMCIRIPKQNIEIYTEKALT
jgi:hypothetical protein